MSLDPKIEVEDEVPGVTRVTQIWGPTKKWTPRVSLSTKTNDSLLQGQWDRDIVYWGFEPRHFISKIKRVPKTPNKSESQGTINPGVVPTKLVSSISGDPTETGAQGVHVPILSLESTRQ